MSIDNDETTQLGVDAWKDTHSQEVVSGALWTAETVQCKCGCDIDRWHTAIGAARVRRQYADDDGRVPACPECVETELARESIPHAIKNMHRGENAGQREGNL